MKKIIITAGGTSEKIDNVRKITNSSSGKLGMTIANHLLVEKDDIVIYYVCSKTSLRPSGNRVHIIEIEGTLDLKNTIEFTSCNMLRARLVPFSCTWTYMEDCASHTP